MVVLVVLEAVEEGAGVVLGRCSVLLLRADGAGGGGHGPQYEGGKGLLMRPGLDLIALFQV